MRQRQRQGSGAVVEPSRPASVPDTVGAEPGPPDSWTPPWDDVFRGATAAQQQELLALADRQGCVYSHQLPSGTTALPSPEPSDPVCDLLPQLLLGRTESLEPLHIRPVAVRDEQLDAAQREAVARALQTPDLFLLQGFPGSGKSRVAAEIVVQEAARGGRVLLLAPQVAALDRVLERLADQDDVYPLRMLAADESLETLSPHSREFTTRGRLDRLRADVLPRARRDQEQAEAQFDQLNRLEPVWAQMLELVAARRSLAEQREIASRARGNISPQVDSEAERARASDAQEVELSPFAARIRNTLRDRDAILSESATARERLSTSEREHKAEAETVTARLESLRPLAEAKENKRWWTGSFWRATFQGDVAGEVTQLHHRLDAAEAGLAAVEAERQRLTQVDADARTHCEETLTALITAEKTSRLAELDARETMLGNEAATVNDKLESLSRELSEPAPEWTESAVALARDAWARRRWQIERRCKLLRDWVGCLEREAESFVARLPERCNVLAVPLAGLPEPFAQKFDLLVVEGADRITEADLLRVARLARRWVLIGRTEAGHRPAEVRRPPPSRFASSRPQPEARKSTAWTGVLAKLWQQLHADPGRLTYAWLEENGRLCCRLRPLTPEQTQWLESERLTDFPDIELRILTQPRGEPTLAEVVFPPAMTVAEAKQFVLREVQETAVQPRGRNVWWVEESDRLVLRLADEPGNDFQPVPLTDGVCEHVRRLTATDAPDTWQTCCVEFAHAAGWRRPQAEEWVHQHLGLRDLGRTLRLEVCHRSEPDLSAFLSDVLFRGEMRSAPRPACDAINGCVVEFSPVPPLHEPGNAGGRNGTPTATLVRSYAALLAKKSGAGLELDLADGRSRDRLPTECRNGLPPTGLVNYLEAQAVVRTLESLSAEAGADSEPVGVAALYPAQAELIRLLVRQSQTLQNGTLSLRVGVPDDFTELECPIMLVSLTRSHANRPVAFGDDPEALALILTRPRRRLMLFGDAGTLVRRTQHDHSVEHLDAVASAREREVLVRLLRYLQGQGAHPKAFQVREGSPA